MSETETPHQRTTQPAPSQAPGPASDRPCIIVDYEKYAHFLEDSGLTDEEKQAFIQAIWSVIADFVSLGFGIHPLQQARHERNNDHKDISSDISDVITWRHPSHTNPHEKPTKKIITGDSKERSHEI